MGISFNTNDKKSWKMAQHAPSTLVAVGLCSRPSLRGGLAGLARTNWFLAV